MWMKSAFKYIETELGEVALIGKYNFKVWAVALKKQSSLLQNTINLGTVENKYHACYTYFPHGTIAYLREGADCKALQDYLVSRLKPKEIKTNVKQKYTAKSIVLSSEGQSINWMCSYDHHLYMSKVYDSNDETYFMFYFDSVPVTVIIDVNGEKGPNRRRYDVFFMGLSNHNDYKNPALRIMLTD